MKNLIRLFLALVLCLPLAMPAEGASPFQTTTSGRANQHVTTFSNSLGVQGQIILWNKKDVFRYFFLGTQPAQDTTLNILDPGVASTNIMTTDGNFTVNGNWVFPSISIAGTSFNGTFDVVNGLGQATAYILPDPGSASANVLLDQGVTSAITIQHVAVPITSANILAMYATPVQLIAAGAAGTNILVHKFMFTMVSSATAYTSGGVVAPQIGNTIHGAGTLTTGTIAASVVNAGAGTTYTTVIPAAYTGTAATGLFLSNQTGAFATGTGTAVADVWYSIK